MSFDFDAAVVTPFRMQPGLRRLAPRAHQLTPAVVPQRGAARHLREKLAVLWAFRSQALLATDGFDAQPALQALANHAAAEHPQALVIDGNDWLAPWLGWRIDGDQQPHSHQSAWPEIGQMLLDTPPAWRHAALLSLAFAEDFAIVDAGTGTLPWLAVALPSMWAPEEKVGRHFTEVHAPVADAKLVLQASTHLLNLVTGPVRWERFVWTLTGHPRLHAHPDRVDPQRWPADMPADQIAQHTWWRTERQSFIPLPDLKQAVFTIHVDSQPLSSALALPEHAGRVHDALASMSDAVLAYRGLAAVRPALLAWLHRRASGLR